jgi:hypothetical protein
MFEAWTRWRVKDKGQLSDARVDPVFSGAGPKIVMRRLSRIFAWCWASPNTLLGLLVALLCLSRPRWHGGVIEAAGGGLAFLLRPWAQAITLGHVILARSPRSLAALRAHERRHVRQYERLGPFFLPAYFLIGAVIWLRGGRPYLDHPLERQAGLGEPRE